MSRQKPPRFSFGAPQKTEPEREMPAALDIVEYDPEKLAAKKARLAGGAYDPYAKASAAEDAVPARKKRMDLRKLSAWIKTTQQVKAQRAEESAPEAKPPRGK